MSIWTDIGGFLSGPALDAFSGVIERIRTALEGDAETRRRVAFSVALIALSAKMAKADGIVTREETAAFREVFDIPEDELANVSRLYDLAKRDVAGFDSYASQVRSLFPGDGSEDRAILHDVIDALFHIAKADGFVHENELLFLEDISVEFGFDEADFACIKLRHVSDPKSDPFAILGAEREWPFDRLKAHYRKRVMDSHPDRLIARGVPPEFVGIATARLAAINAAWDEIAKLHEGGSTRRAATVS